MPTNPNKLSQFWQELKRRNVVRVVTIYAGVAFVIIELINNITDPLRLPEWTPTLVIVLLAIGFPIVIIVSWIYDIHPEGGIVKTEPAHKVKEEGKPTSSKRWKLATYVSAVIIVGLLALNIFGGTRRVKIDESLVKSIAVLPFENFSTEPNQEAMCLGLTDEIINHLFRIESFEKVASLTSVLNYRDPDHNIPEIAEELGVNYILEGVYKKIGNQLRVSAQLIQAGRDGHIWQHDYDQPYQEIISLQSDIALQIADHLEAYISEEEKEIVKRIPTANQEAYELYQQGLYLYNTSNYYQYKEIIELAKKAVELDPKFANAYATIGNMILSEGFYFGEKEMQSAAWEAIGYMEKALELDPDNVIAHSTMYSIDWFVKWNYAEAENIFSKFSYLINSDVNFLFAHVLFLVQRGKYDEVLALVSDHEHFLTEHLIQAHVLLGHTSRAFDLIDKYIAMNGTLVYSEVGEVLNWLGEFDSAILYLDSAVQMNIPTSYFPRYQSSLAVARYKTGDTIGARNIISQLTQQADISAIRSPAYFTGWYYSWIGEVDSAFLWLEKAYNNRSPEMPWLKANPAFNSLIEDDRYWDLYERTGHKAYDDYMASKQQ